MKTIIDSAIVKNCIIVRNDSKNRNIRFLEEMLDGHREFGRQPEHLDVGWFYTDEEVSVNDSKILKLFLFFVMKVLT